MLVCKQTPRQNVQLVNRPSENTAKRNNAHWAHLGARKFARTANTAVPLECGKQGTISFDRRHLLRMEHKIFDNSGNSVQQGALKTYS